MSVHKRLRRRLQPAQRREEILAAALRAFTKGGFHGTHVDEVIREAGIARGTFYLHFDGKRDVFAALVDRMLEVFLTVRPSYESQTVRGPKDAERILRASYAVVLETFRKNRLLCRLLFEEAVGVEQGFTERLAKHFREWHERVHRTLDEFKDHGAARRDLDAEVTAELVLGMVERLTRRYLLPDKAPDLDRLVDAVVAFEMRGISP